MTDCNVEDVLVNKKKTLSPGELADFSKEELIEKVLQLQAHNVQLRNIIARKIAPPIDVSQNENKFDFSKCHKIHVFFRILYLGWNYQGFACQEDTNETIEHYIMKALLKCKLIEAREKSNYHRCGRTDKGVSSFGQVISITVRASDPGKPSLEYCKMLNRLLPPDIRAVSWQAVPDNFSSRFDCKARVYKYYFPKSNLNLQSMNEAVKYLVGSHDFRNICKMDVGNGVTNFIRNIEAASVSVINDDKEGYQMCELTVVGNAFIWHQIRCIAALLVLVGQNLEKPSIILELLDIKKNPRVYVKRLIVLYQLRINGRFYQLTIPLSQRKPQYLMACPKPLNLFNCRFDNDDWNIDDEEIQNVIETLQKQWTEHQIKAVQVRSMLEQLEPLTKTVVNGQISAVLRRESKNYKPLLSRHQCLSLEDRIQHYAKKLKTDHNSPI